MKNKDGTISNEDFEAGNYTPEDLFPDYPPKSQVESLKGLLDKPSDLPISQLPVPDGVPKELKQAMKEERVDAKIYGYKELAEEIKNMPEEPKITSGFEEIDEQLDGGFQAGELVILSAPTKNGKCFRKGTKVLMYDGNIKNIEDVVIGDKLMGPNSKPRNVLNLGRGREMMYRITLRNGDYFECNKSHILSLRKTGDTNTSRYNRKITSSRYSKGEIINISVTDYLKESENFKHLYKAYKSNEIIFKKRYKKNYLKVDPYFVGLWLGDGNTDNIGITTADKEIIDYLYDFANKIKLKVTVQRERSRANRYSIVRENNIKPVNNRNKSGYGRVDSLTDKMRWIGLIGKKFIPVRYKKASIGNRLRLLAGLIDSDGFKNDPSNLVFCNKNKVLAKDVLFLARSLGFSSSITKKYNKKYNRYYYNVNISGDLYKIPLLLKYKLPKNIKRKKDNNYSFTVEKLIKDDYYGVVIDDDNLFLLSDFTVVHNTTMAQTMSYVQATKGVKSMWFSLEMSWQELTRKFLKMDANELIVGKPDDLGIYSMIDYRGLSLKSLELKIKEAVREYGIKIVYIDHLHFLLPLGETKNVSFVIGGIVREVKQIAMRNDVTIVLVAHTKKLETDARPDINSMRDSSFIAQESDFTFIMWRHREDRKRKMTNDMHTGVVYSDVTFVSLEANRRNGNTQSWQFGLINDRFYEHTTYQEILYAQSDEVGNMGDNDEMLKEIARAQKASGNDAVDVGGQQVMFNGE